MKGDVSVMSVIRLTDENMKQLNLGNALIVDNEKWELVEETDYEYEKNGRYKTLYYRQPSTNKIFMITLYQVMFECDVYDFDIYLQDRTATEVRKETMQIEKWVKVIS